jgi:predicted component of type VI protein secretion system
MAESTPEAAAGAARAELFVLSGPDVGRSFAVAHGSSLGRSPDRTVVLRDKSISRNHAHFECEDGQWSIVDDGSTNGFIVDGERSESARLTDLADFLIGEVLVRLRTQLPEPTAAPAPPAPVVASKPVAPPPEEDEIVLEEEIVLERAPSAKPAHTFGKGLAAAAAEAMAAPTLPPAASERSSVAARAAAAGIPASALGNPALAGSGQPPLQFHKPAVRRGVLVADFSQQPLWLRLVASAVIVALAAGLAYGAYQMILGLRQDRAVVVDDSAGAELEDG